MSAKKITYLAVTLALSLILSIVENMLPPVLPTLPYAKLGLSNLVLLLLLIVFPQKTWVFVLILVKCFLAAVFAGALSMALFSVPASLISFAVMLLLLRCKKFGLPAVSAVGAAIYNFVQVAVGAAMYGASIFSVTAYMLLLGLVAGLITGLIVWLIIKYVPKKHFQL